MAASPVSGVMMLVSLGWLAGCAMPAVPDTRAANPEPPPRFAAGGPDHEVLGAAAGYRMGDRATFFQLANLVGSHSHLDEIFPSRLVHKAATSSRLTRAPEPRITWQFEGAELTPDDYLERNATTGLLVARGDTILVERYRPPTCPSLPTPSTGAPRSAISCRRPRGCGSASGTPAPTTSRGWRPGRSCSSMPADPAR